jgi:hypothetical protein
MLIAAGFAGCGTAALSFNDGALSAVNVSAVPFYQEAKFSSQALESAAARLEFASTAEAKAKSAGRRAAQGGRNLGRLPAPRQKAIMDDYTLDVGATPSWMFRKTPRVGSPEWKREQEVTEKQEQEVKQAIEGICRGC